MVSKKSAVDIKVGQIWEDNDPRRKGDRRRLTVLMVKAGYAICKSSTSRRECRIRLDRFRAVHSGYVLVKASFENTSGASPSNPPPYQPTMQTPPSSAAPAAPEGTVS